MKHITVKNDWFYEFRPLIIQAIGIFGIASGAVMVQTGLGKMSFACGVFLIGMGQIIMQWRREYRARNPL